MDHTTSENLSQRMVWAEESLRYAVAHGQHRLAWLLGAVKADGEFERALLALPPGEHLSPAPHAVRGKANTPRTNERGADTPGDTPDDATREARRRERAEEKDRARLAAFELFMDTERRELRLRQNGQLAALLGEPLPGERPSALERLASEDRRQAEEGLVALMGGGKVSYKRVEELREGDMPARAAANRSRTAWLKERRDEWLAGSLGGHA